jgi:hypothetical protein
LALLALLVLGAAHWFMGLQFFYLKSICYYCTAAHGSGLLVALIVIYLTPVIAGPSKRGQQSETSPASSESHSESGASAFGIKTGSALAVTVGAVLLLGIMFNGQMQSGHPKPPRWISGGKDYDSGPGADRYLVILNGIHIRPADWPMLGSPNADHVLVYLFDYTCPHCRRLHRHLGQALDRYGDQLAVMCLPAPLSHHCSDYYKTTSPARKDSCALASIGLSVWLSDHSAFEQFDHAFMDEAKDSTVAVAREIADPLIGAQKLDTLIESKQVRGQILAGGQINGRASQMMGNRNLPKLIRVGGGIPIYSEKSSDLFDDLEKTLGIKPLATGATYQVSRPLAPILLAGGVLTIILIAGFLIAFLRSS